MRRRVANALAAGALAVAAGLAGAQPSDVPATQEIVETLKPTATRGSSGVPASVSLVIHFEPHSARVRPASGPTLGNLVAALLAPELQSSRFVIEGHGEPGASAQARQQLAQQRADEVRQYLVALGVPASRLRASVGAGEAAGPTPAQPEANGRVRVVAYD